MAPDFFAIAANVSKRISLSTIDNKKYSAFQHQNGNALLSTRICFLTGFLFVLWASAVDTHAAYENESSVSTPTCVSCCPSL
jgi:hypothetical protein